jgi:hypothetical protein
VLCEALLRVVTGTPEPVVVWPVLAPCPPLARVATAATDSPMAAWCLPLAAVLAWAWAWPAATTADTPREPRNGAPGSWRITWIVRRITWVRTSTAGLRDARVAVGVLAAGFSANAARPPVATAIAKAAARE